MTRKHKTESRLRKMERLRRMVSDYVEAGAGHVPGCRTITGVEHAPNCACGMRGIRELLDELDEEGTT